MSQMRRRLNSKYLKNNNVRILERKDLEEVFKYIETTYSEKYWEEFACQKSKA